MRKSYSCVLLAVVASLALVLSLSAQQGPINPKAVALLRWYPANLTTSFTVASEPLEVAFDGANIWVANYGSNSVSKLRASDGTLLGTFGVGSGPVGLAFDGANIWVTNQNSNTVSKLRASDGHFRDVQRGSATALLSL